MHTKMCPRGQHTKVPRAHVAVVPGGEAGQEARVAGVAHQDGGIHWGQQEGPLTLPLRLLRLRLLHLLLLLVLVVLRLELSHLELGQA